jgi:hypothetical protein
MNKTEKKKRTDFFREKKLEILGITAFLAAYIFIVWIGSLSFHH